VRTRFLGTRGEIEARTRRHHRHSSLLVGYRRREVMIDCGLDWRDQLTRLRPAAIVLTHAIQTMRPDFMTVRRVRCTRPRRR
jgi:hypothetical protein